MYMSYATGHNSFTSQYLLDIYIYCRFCRFYVINVCVWGEGKCYLKYFCAINITLTNLSDKCYRLQLDLSIPITTNIL
jgi:hypothetical protein